MSQSRLGSLTETLVGTVLAFIIAVGAQIVIFPWFGFNPPMHEHVAIVAIFTVISLVRSYLVRRLFNWVGTRGGE